MSHSNATYARALQILRESLGRPDAAFHEHQWEAIAAIVERKGRTLVVQRTGWGKSAVYFIATKIFRERGSGTTLILSPLLALMRNQIEAASNYGVKLGTINSSNTREENQLVEEQVLADQLDAVIISPERLANTQFVENVLRPIAGRVALLVIDEAHCISDWGHDFRPDYKRITNILEFLPENLPVLGTTATANERVMKDVAAQIGKDVAVLRGKLTRESIRLQSLQFPMRSQRMAWLADTLSQLEGTGIVYVATTRDAELLTSWLKHRGISAEAYYARLRGMTEDESRKERLRREGDLLRNRIKVLVATSALGMGYDKPDLAFVIHFQSPGSVVSYYQQVGRAGRGIPRAYGVLLSGKEDDDIQQHFIRNAFPEERLVESILDLLEASDDGLKRGEIERQLNDRRGRIAAAIGYLAAESPAPILKDKGRYLRTLTDYQLPHEAIARVLKTKTHEWRRMQAYLEHDGCLMQFLARELDDFDTGPCGKCAGCCAIPPLPVSYAEATGLAAVEFLENVVIPIEPRRQAGRGRAEAQARFPQYKFEPRFKELMHEPGRALCRWGEAGWGEIAMHGKKRGRFDPRLVTASTEVILKRWRPEPMPTWVTFVPSHRHARLVPDFARDLAEELGIPCQAVIRQAKENQPQKRMENSHHRCLNLDGAFEILTPLPADPVLLVDDAVDSGWTFAVIAALLRRAGSGPVFPFALMDTSTSG